MSTSSVFCCIWSRGFRGRSKFTPWREVMQLEKFLFLDFARKYNRPWRKNLSLVESLYDFSWASLKITILRSKSWSPPSPQKRSDNGKSEPSKRFRLKEKLLLRFSLPLLKRGNTVWNYEQAKYHLWNFYSKLSAE